MKMKKASKIMALVVAVAMVIALFPTMMVSAATASVIDTANVRGDKVGDVVNFTVPYTLTAGTVGSDQATILVIKKSKVVGVADPYAITYLDVEQTKPDNIIFIDQATYDATTSFTFQIVLPLESENYLIKIGGTEIGSTGVSSLEYPLVVTPAGFTVSGYVQAYTSGATVTLATGVSTTTDVDGKFTFANVLPADYSLVVTAKSALPRTIPVTVATDVLVAPSTNKITLMYGDINNSGKIDVSDLGIVKSLFNRLSNAPDFNINADLNDSGKIDVSDIGLLKSLFSKTSANYAPWVIAQ